MSASAKQSGFTSAVSLFDHLTERQKNPYVSQEFQDYGYRLAVELDDLAHKSLYIKLAKQEPRLLLEQARTYVIDAESARSKARLFMWKLKELKNKPK